MSGWLAFGRKGRTLPPMGATTEYLYGDSTPSPLKTDFIAFLRDTVEFGTKVLLGDARLAEAVLHAAEAAELTEKDVESAEALLTEVSAALDRATAGSTESLARPRADRIRQGAFELGRARAEAARAAAT